MASNDPMGGLASGAEGYEEFLESIGLSAAPVRAASRQQQDLFVELSRNPAARYCIVTHVSFSEPLDLDRLRSAMEASIEEGTILNSSISSAGGVVGFHPLRRSAAAFREVQSRSVTSPTERKALLDRLRTEFIDRESGPLYRTTVIVGDAGVEELVFLAEHIAWDAKSPELFVKRMLARYHDETPIGQRVVSVTCRHDEYVAYQASSDFQEEAAECLEFWADAIDSHELTHMITDFPREPLRRFRGGTIVKAIPHDIRRRVGDVAARCNASPFALHVAAFAILLSIYTRSDDVVFATTVDLRPPGFEDEVGYYVNVIPVRIAVGKQVEITDVIGAAAGLLADVMDYRSVAFGELYNRLAERHGVRGDLFQFELTKIDGTADIVHGTTLARLTSLHDGAARFDGAFVIREDERNTSLHVEFDRDLFRQETIGRMVDVYIEILSRMTSGEAVIVADIEPSSEQDRQFAREVLCPTGDRQEPTTLCWLALPHLSDPARPSIVANGRTWSSADTAGRVLDIVDCLERAGVRRGDRVVTALTRGPELVAGALACMFKGAAFVPLDPEAPPARTASMLRQLTPAAALVEEFGRASPWTSGTNACGTRVIAIGSVTRQLRDAAASRDALAVLAQTVQPCDIAYVIHTSGTTGAPKGVAVGHAAASTFITDITTLYDIRRDDVVLQFASATFDVFIYEVFAALANGGCLVISPTRIVLIPHD